MNISYSYNDLISQFNLLQQPNPHIKSEVIGHSVMGKEILAIKLGQGKREIHYNAAIHANEWITAVLLIKFIAECVRSINEENGFYKGYDLLALLQQTTVWFVPLLNPDGVELVLEGIMEGHPLKKQLLEWNYHSTDFSNWKANIHGVDLNDQFPAHWEEERLRRNVSKPGPMNYSGGAPLCEPEASAIANFTLKHSFALALSLHTQGEEIYWNYRGYEPMNAWEIADKFAEGSGYHAVYLTDSDAGYKDWFIQQFHRPGFTVEAGYGKNPLPIEQLEDMYEKVSKIFLLALLK
ncbi:MAG: M14 family metallocarboxypeptidase [Paenibacillaceae bacterium]